jgi:hypothetical protein
VRGQRVGIGQGAGVGDRLERQQRIHDLLRPAPARGRVRFDLRMDGVEVDHRDQLAQQVGVAQGMRRRRIASLGRERVMHDDPGAVRQHPGGVDAGLAPLGMAEQRGEPGAAGHVQPVTPPGHPQPGFIGMHQLGSGQAGAGRGGEQRQPAAALLVQAATVPTAIGVPNASASNPAVRSTGRCWPSTG